MSKRQEDKIIESWNVNASPWIDAIRNKQIESRELVTNNQIIEAILSRSPRNVLDVGCGEGWLPHTLNKHGMDCTGFDAIEVLIEEASSSSDGKFYVATYEDFPEKIQNERFDLAVCNFSLFGNKSVEQLFVRLKSVLVQKGYLIIQTLHPKQAAENFPYSDGWQQGSWSGFNNSFTQPAPWYFRTFESWLSLFEKSGYDVLETRESIHPRTGKLTSLIIVGQLRS